MNSPSVAQTTGTRELSHESKRPERNPQFCPGTRHQGTTSAISKYLQNAFAIRICPGVWHSGSNSCGLPMSMSIDTVTDISN
jgi:hypothetical protein